MTHAESAPNNAKPAPEWLKDAVREFMQKNRGKLYAQIPHPDFEGWPSSRNNDRFDIIRPHLTCEGGTALDIGTHFGTFAHWLEDLGYRVTAIEKSSRYARVAKEVRNLCGKKFDVIVGDIFDLETPKFDVVLALNIFHHFLKTQEKFEKLKIFLERLDCKLMIFEAHVPTEGQMATAYRNMDQQEFAAFVSAHTGLTAVEIIGAEGQRAIFKLTRPMRS